MWFDASVVESVVDSLPLWAAFLVLALSYLGSVYLIVPVTVGVYLREQTERATSWPVFIISAYALFVFLKPLSGIERPSVDSPLANVSLPIIIDQLHHFAVDFDTGSFPSGHAIAATVFYGLLAIETDLGNRWLRATGVVTLLVGVYISRIALGIHYLGDVVGGAVIGLAFLWLLLWLRKQLQTPAETLLMIPAILGIGAVVLGEIADGIGILVAVSGFYVIHTRFGKNLRARFDSPSHSTNVSEQ